MRFEEFERHAHNFIQLISEVYQRVHLLGYEYDKELDYRTQLLDLQREARKSFDKITHIVDLGCNRTMIFGEDKNRIDVSRASLDFQSKSSYHSSRN